MDKLPQTTGGDGRDLLEPCRSELVRGPLTEEQRELAVRYLPLARQLAHRLETTLPTRLEDVHATACRALVEAARSYDSSRNVGFGVYARHRIRGALRDFQRLLHADGCRATDTQRPAFPRLREPELPVDAWIESPAAVEHWLSQLPRAHAAACRLIYIHGRSQDQAAVEVGCSKSYLSRLHREAITWLIREYHQARTAR